MSPSPNGDEHGQETCLFLGTPPRPRIGRVVELAWASSPEGQVRPVVHGRCAGLDVHKKTVVACVLVTGEEGTVQEQVRTFGTMTSDLSARSRWLQEQQVEQVALESTGV